MLNNEVINKIRVVFENSGFRNVQITKTHNNMYLIQAGKINEYNIYAFVRKISGSGWKNKPDVRRVQVQGFDLHSIAPSSQFTTSMIIGLDSLYEKDILVLWNIYNFGNHKKNRSCYVSVKNIFHAYNKGFHIGMDFKQKIWISDQYNLHVILKDYIKYNKISLGEKNEHNT